MEMSESQIRRMYASLDAAAKRAETAESELATLRAALAKAEAERDEMRAALVEYAEADSQYDNIHPLDKNSDRWLQARARVRRLGDRLREAGRGGE